MLYRALYLILNIIFFLLGFKVKGCKNAPRQGAYIVASNHISNWDPVLVALALPRPVAYMAKIELFKGKVLGWLIRQLHAFPVDRNKADRQAIRTALQILKSGNIVGIFPEGHRNKNNEDLKINTGVAFLALKAGVPVLPVACVGSRRIIPWGWFSPMEVRIGTPIDIKALASSQEHVSLDEISQEIMRKIHFLLNK